MNLLIALLITICFYMSVPFFVFFRNQNKYTSDFIRNFNIINSIIAFALDTLLVFLLTKDGTLVKIYPPIIYYFINNAIWQKNANKEVKIKNHQNNNNTLLIALGIIIISLGAITIYEYNENNKLHNTIKHLETSFNNVKIENDEVKDELKAITNGKPYFIVKEKLNFYDNNIVFVVNGYNNYMSYDCMIEKFDGTDYSYWAYNKNAAISQGYIEYNC